MWYVRTRPPVMQAFAHMWSVKSEDLLVSFDGCCAFRPPSVDVRPAVTVDDGPLQVIGH